MELICRVNMFDMTQSVILINGNEVVERRPAKFDNFGDVIMGFTVDFPEIEKVTLYGSALYNMKLKDEILKKEFEKYNHNKLKVELS